MKKSLCFAAVTAGTMLAGTGVASGQEAPPSTSRSPVKPHTVATGETRGESLAQDPVPAPSTASASVRPAGTRVRARESRQSRWGLRRS